MATLSELPVDAQVSIRGAPPAGFPVEPNTTAMVDGRTALWLGPDEWLVLGGREEEHPQSGAAVDVSANRVILELEGDDAADVLAQGCSLDLHPSVFMPGSCAQTLLARAQVILFRPDESRFLVLVRPSFVPYLRAWLEDAIEGATNLRSSR
jgi:sarcosine oxidase, subunit gamma